MGASYRLIRVGSQGGDKFSTYDNTYLQQFPSVIEYKQGNFRRVKPIGVEALFNGTAVGSWKIQYATGVYTVRLENQADPSGSWWQNMVAFTAPQVGDGLPSLYIATKYWSTKLANEIRDTDLNLAQSFAERRQVENMFVNYSKRVVKAYRAARRGNPQGVFNALLGTSNRTSYKAWKQTVKDTTGVASDTWLAWTYGVKPLVRDLSGAVDEYYKVRAAAPLIRKYRFRVSYPGRIGGVQRGGGSYYADPPYTYVSTGTQKASVVAYAEFEDSAQSWDQSAQRLGLTDPALLLWELIPFSFVADWFVNVGDFLQATGTFQGLKRLGIHVTTTNTETDIANVGNGVAMVKRVTKNREFYPYLPAPLLTFKANPLSLSHITSALALIRQVGVR